jgi:ADP-heptose:LPS heptosyltransferase
MLDIDVKDSHLQLWPSKKDEEYIENFLNQQWLGPKQMLVGMNLSASKRWPTKAWPVDYIARLCETLALKDIRMVFTGETEDLFQASSIVDSLESAKPIVACGKTSINQLISLIKRCQVFISPDSAPLHIACAVRTPYIALFGPSDPKRHLSPGYKGILLYKNLPCSPCYKPRCKTRECMYAIKPQEVLEAVESLLKGVV